MRQVARVASWVVYEMPATAKRGTMKVVCEQREWGKLKRGNPTFKLVRSRIANEGEAEREARAGTIGLRNPRKRFRWDDPTDLASRAATRQLIV